MTSSVHLLSFPSVCNIKLCAFTVLVLLHFTSSLASESLLQLPILGSYTYRPVSERVLHVHAFGAVGDGLHDDTEAFRSAWKVACSFSRRSLILIPKGYTYLVKPIDFAGCQSEITIRVLGAIIAPEDPEVWIGMSSRRWLYFHSVKHLTLEGEGTINGMGKIWWNVSCKVNETIPCHHAPTAITFHRCQALKIRDVSIMDSQQTHMSFTNCNGVTVSNVSITAPGNSPNTDGIHISASTNVEVSDTAIRTGDDCISIVSNSSRISIANVICGPGHGVSIGSLGKSHEWSEVHNVMVDRLYLSNTQNGLRIKTWQGGAGFVTRVRYQNIWMENVKNPIVVDQYYCDSSKPCQNQTSSVSIDNISFVGIRGTSAQQEAIRFACSDSRPCRDLHLEDIELVTYEGPATSFCWNAEGSDCGVVYPPPCFTNNGSIIQQSISCSSSYSS